MNIFDIVPENYFSIFSGKNRNIYAESLLVLFSLVEDEDTLVRKADFIRSLKDKAQKELNAFEYEKEDLDDLEEDALLMNTIASKASFICSRLEETGWIDVAMDDDTFEEIIVVPTYSFALLRSMRNIISDEESPYVSLVHSTYSELKLEDEEQDELLYTTLNRCFDNTRKLKIELKTLNNSIRVFKNRLGGLFQTNAVLHQYFDEYKTKVSDRYYHPLKTFDSVAKYRRPIIKILDKWLRTSSIREKLIEQCMASSKVGMQKEEAEALVIRKINYISDTYDTINKEIAVIDSEHNVYTKNSANKILYLNNTDKTIKGHLENILKCYAENVNNGRVLSKVLSKMQDACYFYEQGYIDSKSVTLPILRKFRYDGEPIPIMDGLEASDMVMSNFLEETRNIYTDERIYQFMENAFGGANEVYMSEIPLIDYDAFVCIILATIKKDDEDCFYTVEDVDGTNIKNRDFSVPNLVFRKKENFIN